TSEGSLPDRWPLVRGSGLLRQPTKSWRGRTRRNSLTSLGTGDPGRAVVVVVRQRPHPRGGDRGARLRGAGVEASGRVEVCPLEQGPDLARPGRTPQPSLCYRPRSRLTPTSTCTHEDEHAPGEAALDRGARSGGNLRRRARSKVRPGKAARVIAAHPPFLVATATLDRSQKNAITMFVHGLNHADFPVWDGDDGNMGAFVQVRQQEELDTVPPDQF